MSDFEEPALSDVDNLTPEPRMRREIGRKLRECGWYVQNYRSYNLGEGLGVVVREYPTDKE